jgi:hypothetical protein
MKYAARVKVIPISPLPIIIDIEASGFGVQSYPIEVGVVLDSGQRYCSLIKPQKDWQHWDHAAEQLHGISRELLQRKGVSVSQVCLSLNQLLVNNTVYSDGWVVDQPWLIELYKQAGLEMSFRLSPIEMILSEQQMELWHETKNRLMLNLQGQRHRASVDAELIQQTYLATRYQQEKQLSSH